ncbi:FHA domain-containing protein [bacterium]|jgi:hypothetical protein|nr:FHA domain-containing protein [bacterium]
MKISLVVLTAGKMMGKEIPITVAEFRIGKDPSCQLKPAAGVSDKHCAFLVKQGKLFLQDLGSAEGTFVNDNKISSELELKAKDKVKVGPLLFEIKIEGAPVAKPVAAAPPQAAAKPEPKKPSADGDDDLDDLLFDDDDKAPGGAKPSWKDAVPEAGADKAQDTATEGGAKPEEKPKPVVKTSDAAAALLSKFRPKK